VVRRRVGELLEIVLVHPAGVDAGVERRVGSEGEDLARLRVHGDERATVGRPLAVVVREPDPERECVLSGLLQLGVDGEAHVVPGLGKLLELARARHAAERVHVDAADAGQAA
jgi:hypothetical protein